MNITNLLARFLLKRLRSVEPKTLRKLKSELENFNARTDKWKQAGASVPLPHKAGPTAPAPIHGDA